MPAPLCILFWVWLTDWLFWSIETTQKSCRIIFTTCNSTLARHTFVWYFKNVTSLWFTLWERFLWRALSVRIIKWFHVKMFAIASILFLEHFTLYINKTMDLETFISIHQSDILQSCNKVVFSLVHSNWKHYCIEQQAR